MTFFKNPKRCKHKAIGVTRKELTLTTYLLHKNGKYYEDRSENIDTETIKIRCKLCNKELTEEEIQI